MTKEEKDILCTIILKEIWSLSNIHAELSERMIPSGISERIKALRDIMTKLSDE